MENLLKEINEDFDWRLAELSTIKTLPFRYSISIPHRDFLLKYSVPMIYSVWEGFVKNTFSVYLSKLNKLKLTLNELNINYLVHSIDYECQLSDGRTTLASKSRLIEQILEIIEGEVPIANSIPTKSNVNFKVLNQLMALFKLDKVDESYKSPLNKLLLFRNKISHGENAIIVQVEDVNEFSKLVEDLMVDIIVLLEDGINKECYKKLEG